MHVGRPCVGVLAGGRDFRAVGKHLSADGPGPGERGAVTISMPPPVLNLKYRPSEVRWMTEGSCAQQAPEQEPGFA